jgi:hypothetical protein
MAQMVAMTTPAAAVVMTTTGAPMLNAAVVAASDGGRMATPLGHRGGRTAWPSTLSHGRLSDGDGAQMAWLVTRSGLALRRNAPAPPPAYGRCSHGQVKVGHADQLASAKAAATFGAEKMQPLPTLLLPLSMFV